jgi:tRNA modification GTPase
LKKIDVCIDEIRDGVNQTISNELIALDLRRALQYIGEITGEVEIDRDILGSIFGKFCIGK